MKKMSRDLLLITMRRTRKLYGLVCACILIMLGAIILGSFTSTSSLQHLLFGGDFINHDLTKELKHIHIQAPPFSRDTNEVNKDGQVSQHNIDDRHRLINTVIKDATFKGSSKENGPRIKDVIEMENVDIKAKGTRQRCTKSKALLRVFMYDLPPELHFGMIEPLNVKDGNIWPTDFTNMVRYPGGLYQQHSPEYWLTLDLLNNLEEEEEEEEGGQNILNCSCSRVKEGHGHNKVKANDVYNTFYTNLDERGHYVNHPLYPKVERGHYINHPLYPKVERGHGIDSSYAKVGTRRPCGAIRVKDERDADVYFVPFFSSLSYNKYSKLGMRERDMELQEVVVNYVMKQEAWKMSTGRNHVFVMHHPNSLQMARTLLEGATFIVADFGRLPSTVAHFGKDIVAPYHHIIPSFQEDNSSFLSRPTLLFFQGAILRKEGGVIRKKLYSIIKNEKGVVFKDKIHGKEGIKSATKGMRSSKFCLHLAGDTPSSNRLFDAIASHCVPVIISKDIELPYEDALDYSEFCIFIDPPHALQKGFLIDLLRNIRRDRWTKMWKRLKEVQVHFEYQFPSQEDDAVQMLWKSIANKVPTIKQDLHKYERYSRSNIFKKLSFY